MDGFIEAQDGAASSAADAVPPTEVEGLEHEEEDVKPSSIVDTGDASGIAVTEELPGKDDGEQVPPSIGATDEEIAVMMEELDMDDEGGAAAAAPAEPLFPGMDDSCLPIEVRNHIVYLRKQIPIYKKILQEAYSPPGEDSEAARKACTVDLGDGRVVEVNQLYLLQQRQKYVEMKEKLDAALQEDNDEEIEKIVKKVEADKKENERLLRLQQAQHGPDK